MGKNHRHSKKLKSEKNKVHIKTKTKFLPKGQNVTNTAFKIKPIILQTQLKESESAPYKPLNIKETVSKLKHHNSSIKTETCKELKDRITKDPKCLQTHYWTIFPAAASLIEDREKTVRREAIKLFNAIFEQSDSVDSYFRHVVLNLKCAMTHIDKRIQEDSLLLLDSIIEHKTDYIAKNFDDLLMKFLMLISRLKGQSGSERVLSLNLEGKVTSVKWRVKVLTRLYGMFNSIVDFYMKQKEIKSGNLPVIGFDINRLQFLDRDYSAWCAERTGRRKNPGENILSLVKLLDEIWVEVMPEKNSTSEQTVLINEDSVAVFSCVVHILKLLHLYIQNCSNFDCVVIFNDANFVRLFDHLLISFPYSHSKRNLKIAEDFPRCSPLNANQNFREENLLIIFLFISVRVRNGKKPPRLEKIRDYLDRCLQSRLNSSSFSILLKIFKLILIQDKTLCQKLGIKVTEIVEKLSNLYFETKEEYKSDILDVLNDPRLEKNDFWLEKLPQFLCEKTVSVEMLRGILGLCLKGNEAVKNELRKSSRQILDNLDSVEFFGEEIDKVEVYIQSIFHQITLQNEESLEEVKKFVNERPQSRYCKLFQSV